MAVQVTWLVCMLLPAENLLFRHLTFFFFFLQLPCVFWSCLGHFSHFFSVYFTLCQCLCPIFSLFSGEIVVNEVNFVKKCIGTENSQDDLVGKLICTNFKVSFLPQDAPTKQVLLNSRTSVAISLLQKENILILTFLTLFKHWSSRK